MVDRVEQKVLMINENEKAARLMKLLTDKDFVPPAIIFVNQKKGADVLAKGLEQKGIDFFFLFFWKLLYS